MRVDPRLCIICRGRGYCGLAYCIALVRSSVSVKLSAISRSNIIEGSSPPAVFVGRIGYPKVRLGPASPPEYGDTRIFDTPELWVGKRLEEILDYRLGLVYGTSQAKVTDVSEKLVDEIRLIAMSFRPVDVMMVLSKPPKPGVILSEETPPIGPRSPLEKIVVKSNPHIPRPVEKVYNDTDLRASDAIWMLYNNSIPVSHIQRLLAVGALGVSKNRRLVPTRWSITAVDSTLSRRLLEEVKEYPLIDEIEVYVHRGYDNLFIAILYPRVWSFEWMEAWWPGSTWNPLSKDVVVEGDYELYSGRDEYPSIGGCYYASMLATLEHLRGVRRQATAILFREIYPGFNIPIGVWFVREMARAMYRRGPILKTRDWREVAEVIDKESRLGWKKWLDASRLVKIILSERTLDEYIKH